MKILLLTRGRSELMQLSYQIVPRSMRTGVSNVRRVPSNSISASSSASPPGSPSPSGSFSSASPSAPSLRTPTFLLVFYHTNATFSCDFFFLKCYMSFYI